MLEKFGLVSTMSKAVVPGDIYGKLVVVFTGQIPGTYRYCAVCKCSCGSPLKIIRMDSLRNGETSSCGCYHKEVSTTHGMSNSRHYGRWRNMMDRCYNPECHAYSDYGGRGIKVCDDWHNVTQYVAYVGWGYEEGSELDRIDNDGDYVPGNVRWIKPKGNCNNRRSCHYLTYRGVTKTMSEWADEYGLVMQTLWERIEVWGWDVEKALITPIADKVDNMRKAQSIRWQGHVKVTKPEPRVVKTYQFEGNEYTMAELSRHSGFSTKLLRKRICERGWSVDRAVTEKAWPRAPVIRGYLIE